MQIDGDVVDVDVAALRRPDRIDAEADAAGSSSAVAGTSVVVSTDTPLQADGDLGAAARAELQVQGHKIH